MGARFVPKSLKDAIDYFADEDAAVEFARDIRWPSGVNLSHVRSEGPVLHLDSAPLEVQNYPSKTAILGQGGIYL